TMSTENSLHQSSPVSSSLKSQLQVSNDSNSNLIESTPNHINRSQPTKPIHSSNTQNLIQSQNETESKDTTFADTQYPSSDPDDEDYDPNEIEEDDDPDEIESDADEDIEMNDIEKHKDGDLDSELSNLPSDSENSEKQV
ncbi:MAG TPA: hypothetical protein VGW31_12680, partial [Hanamia sp.]|nr:hypothetical protein [Hanamia sp.]